jgi:hypothetical protein
MIAAVARTTGVAYLTVVLTLVLLLAPSARAQSDQQAEGNEFELWTGGGKGTNGSTVGTGAWNVGVRYGWMLTDPHGPGFLRGQFEFALDAVPIFWVFQRTGTAYGFGLNPLGLKWNFEPHRRVAPYFELGGGTLFTNQKVPDGTSRVNFTSGGALGVRLLRSKRDWSAEIRYMHISNAGLTVPNPGVNTIQLRLGFDIRARKK